MKTKLSVIIICLSVYLITNAQQQPRVDENARKLSLALYAITNLYVDKVDEGKSVEDAIVGMLNKLDPHSEYSDAEETKRLTEPLESNFDGIGIQFNMLKDTLYVVQVISGGPSEKVGLLAGDRIIFVEDTLIAGVSMKNTDIQKLLRGPKGTEVHVKVKRNNKTELLGFKITRGNIPITSLDAAYMVDRTTGYIRLSRFAMSSIDEFNQAMTTLKRQGMQNLILDLQNNGGGYLHVANYLADEFLDKDKLIVYTQGNKQPRENLFATEKGNFEKGRLIVMVDQFSASASEIVSGAIQDWDRGIILGRRTFGKGLVQKPIPMPDGSMIRLTVARYYTPSGRNIQKPYTSGDSKEYDRDLIERYNRGELMSADSTHFPDSLKFNTLVSKRIVYGGGGIMPDVFIPLDTALYTDYHRKVINTGLINQVAINYLDRNRSTLNKRYSNINVFKKNFEVPDEAMQNLQNLATEEKIEFDGEQYNKSESLMKLQIKALIARDLFDMNEYYQIINDENASLKEALRIINNPVVYNKILEIQ
ncbi:MAG: S41 family peptidase [Tannerella sp.]|jgi:carboxyl-terminal processing protease|nr:S41 family peptidase [Tannerella sp.]